MPEVPKATEEELFIRDNPEFIVTRVRYRSDPFEVVEHLAQAPSDGVGMEGDHPTLKDALSRARFHVEERGGVCEVWQRVGCYKAEAKQWC
jgi:hypothetical protein